MGVCIVYEEYQRVHAGIVVLNNVRALIMCTITKFDLYTTIQIMG